MTTSPLTAVPPRVRARLYWAGYVLGVLGQGVTIVWGAVAASSPDVAMPLWLVIVSAVLGLLQTQLNLLAGSNLPSLHDVVAGEVTAVDGVAVEDVRGRHEAGADRYDPPTADEMFDKTGREA